MKFPKVVSMTLTFACGLRCKMCGQWELSRATRRRIRKAEMPLGTWKRLVDEAARHKVKFILIRGGEPFLYPGIMELLRHIRRRGIFTAIDTNGMHLSRHACELARLGIGALNVSIDGPERTHDSVRGAPGSFARIERGIRALREACRREGREIPLTACYTISPYSYRGLGRLPGAVRRLGIPGVSVVPYYFFDGRTGRRYEDIMRREFGCEANSWKGFERRGSGIDIGVFLRQWRAFKRGLKGLRLVPFMDMSEKAYRAWFRDGAPPVNPAPCGNPWKLIDIQPDGSANFCVDFCDYGIGNVKDSSIARLWSGRRAERFRRYIKNQPLPVCGRCGARYI